MEGWGFHPYLDIQHNWTAELSAASDCRTLPTRKFLGASFR